MIKYTYYEGHKAETTVDSPSSWVGGGSRIVSPKQQPTNTDCRTPPSLRVIALPDTISGRRVYGSGGHTVKNPPQELRAHPPRALLEAAMFFDWCWNQ